MWWTGSLAEISWGKKKLLTNHSRGHMTWKENYAVTSLCRLRGFCPALEIAFFFSQKPLILSDCTDIIFSEADMKSYFCFHVRTLLACWANVLRVSCRHVCRQVEQSHTWHVLSFLILKVLCNFDKGKFNIYSKWYITSTFYTVLNHFNNVVCVQYQHFYIRKSNKINYSYKKDHNLSWNSATLLKINTCMAKKSYWA